MNFKISREAFLEGLSKTQGVVEKKNTMPVLSNVLLDADQNGLKICGTDLEVSLVSQLPAHIKEPGKITVSARSLHDIVREIKEDEIHVSLETNDRICIQSGKSVFHIPGLNAQEFPSLPKVDAESMEFPCEFFAQMLEKTSFSMATDDTRHNLAGVLLEKAKEPKLRMVATDGHRLSLVDSELAQGGLNEMKVIIPKKGVLELKKIVAKEGSFELAVGKKNLFCRKGNETLYVRLIDGDFPDYTRVIPKNNHKEALVPKEKFVGALRRVSLLSNERSRGVVVAFSSGHLEVSINNPDLGEAREEFEIDYQGETIKIGFNAKYFLDALSVVKEDAVRFSFENDLSPCLIKSSNDDGFLCVIMPMRI